MELLERSEFLVVMETALADANAGAGRIVLVSGEAGIGKTSLVAAFTRSLQGQAPVLWGVCDSLFTPRPLGPLHDMAAQMQGPLPGLLASDAARPAILGAFLQELYRGTAVLVFEDVHWADEATLDLLRFAGRRIDQTPALLVLTYRDDELGPQHPLRSVLGDLVGAPAARRVMLPSLSAQAVRTLVGERGVDANALHQKTGGNPFFVTEVLASAASGNPAGIPPTIRDAVLARAARLSLSGRMVLEAAAVIGPRIEPWLLSEVTGAEAYAAEESITAGMLLPQGDNLIFRHELARQIILETIFPPRRQVLNRMVLDSLKASPSSRTHLARLAHHAEAAGDRESVQVYAPAAARQASSAGAHREAASLYQLALRYSDELPADQCAHLALLLEAYSQECDLVGRQLDGIAARRRAVDLWRELGNPLKEGENLAYLMSMLNRVGQNAEAQGVSQASVEILEALPPGRELAMAYRMQAALCLVNRDYEDALAWASKAGELARRFQDAEVLAAVQITTGTAWLFLDYERGRKYLESKTGAFRQAGLDARVAHLYSNLGSASGELYEFQHAQHYLNAGVAYADERDLDSHRLYMLAWQALVQFYLGNWSEAGHLANSVLQSTGATVISRITALVALGRLHARRGAAGANAALEKALELATTADSIQRLGAVHSARAEAAWLAGDPGRILEEASVVYNLALSKRHPWFSGELAFWRWRAGEAVDLQAWMARPFALQISGEWLAAAEEWERLGCPYEQARALADGDASAKMRALDIFEQLGAQPAADNLRQALRAEGARAIPHRPRPSTRKNPFNLTARQLEILGLLLEGLSNAEIAARLHISPKTADHHVSAVLARLDVHSRDAAAAIARQHPHFQQNRESPSAI